MTPSDDPRLKGPWEAVIGGVLTKGHSGHPQRQFRGREKRL